MELVSVIIPAYNSQASLRSALDSVLAQTYRRVEIIVIDDGSSDNTADVARQALEDVATCAWQVIELPENRGPSAARNEGLQLARGHWVQFLDSDDLLAPTKLERQMTAASVADPNVVALHSPWQIGSVPDRCTEWEGHLCDPDIEGRPPVMCLVPRVRPLLAAALVRMSALEEVGGFNDALRFWECEELCLRLARVGPFVNVPSDEPLYLWQMPQDQDYIGHVEAKYGSMDVGLAWIDRLLDAAGRRTLDDFSLSREDADLLLDECAHWARRIHHQDRAAFGQYMAKLRIFAPAFRPRRPWPLALAARVLSYERAEALAEAVRGPRRALARALRLFALGNRPQ